MGKPTRLSDILKDVEQEIRTNCENAGVSNETASTGSD